MIETLNI